MMDREQALDLVVRRTGHTRFRELLDPAHPDYNPAMWTAVMAIAGQPMPEPEYPPVPSQARFFIVAMWRWARSGFRLADAMKRRKRLAICRACPEFVEADVACRRCGCALNLKARIQSSNCPIGKW